MLLSFGLVLFSLVIGGIVLIGSVTRLQEKELSQRLTITAQTVANLPSVVESISSSPNPAAHIAPLADNIRILNDVAYIVVLDMDRKRLSHPLSERIGTTFNSTDGDPAFAEHMYVSKVRGEAGIGLRSYVPVMNKSREQIGVVVAGGLLPGVGELVRAEKRSIAVTSLLSLIFGIFGSALLARHIKRQMFDLEPHEIARMFRERTAAFQAMHEGVIAIDRNENVTIMNERAKRIFGVKRNVNGLPIREVIPNTRLPEVLHSGQAILGKELNIGGTVIWSNRIPIRENGVPVGAIAIFQDRTDLTRMAEELTGVREFVHALRAQNHEHMNKMHTIAGLLQLGKLTEALDYLFAIAERQEEITRFLQGHFHDDGVAGLLLGKISRGKELGIELTIDKDSRLERFPGLLDRHDFVLLLGNLIENAFDALAESDMALKEIYISIRQDEELLGILIEDNGCGMDEETKARMLERGYSTKSGESRGMGLYLLNEIVAKGNGVLKCDSSIGLGTSIEIVFPMKGGGDGDEQNGKSGAAGGSDRG
ncbi:histidine kinase [Paenibacillus darwinianus]|uniref:histidine kinase n=1 Tax=Paenibacillus darwinianus TaxID=1380763 RepID=A0A9W5S2Z9_9BACL|nr:sensor histidine kinase [Paenibacillus darwinianus]EXX90382.1 histidine kinase [Paenibacillus darwinianus]EXX91098.1 histidine kinase [Paenibacillus darwinianus]EXX91960.1 histidine kinase [Paenibacillus darwinianus]